MTRNTAVAVSIIGVASVLVGGYIIFDRGIEIQTAKLPGLELEGIVIVAK